MERVAGCYMNIAQLVYFYLVVNQIQSRILSLEIRAKGMKLRRELPTLADVEVFTRWKGISNDCMVPKKPIDQWVIPEFQL
jgi:hypothetical protein